MDSSGTRGPGTLYDGAVLCSWGGTDMIAAIALTLLLGSTANAQDDGPADDGAPAGEEAPPAETPPPEDATPADSEAPPVEASSDQAPADDEPPPDDKTPVAATEDQGDKKKKKPKKDRWPKFAAIPIPMVNPTVGWGIGVMAMLAYKIDKNDEVSPPSATILFGMYSSSKSWAVGAAQRMYIKEDDWRVFAAAGYASANITYYARAGSWGFEIPMSSNGTIFIAKAWRRVIERLYLGLGYKVADVTVELDLYDPIPDFETRNLQTGPMVVLEYDRRDNVYSATKGWYVEGSAAFLYRAFGADVNYTDLDLAANGYLSITDPKYVLAGRVFWNQAVGDVPFWAQPAFGQGNDLRGYAYGEYRGDLVLASQLEFRWNFIWRFGLVVFGGLGTATNSWADLGSAPTLPSYGGGLRFNLYPKERIMLAIDYARGRNDGFFYFGVNEAF